MIFISRTTPYHPAHVSVLKVVVCQLVGKIFSTMSMDVIVVGFFVTHIRTSGVSLAEIPNAIFQVFLSSGIL